VDEAKEAELVVGRLRSEPRGVLKGTTSGAFGTPHIAPANPALLARYPEISIDLTIDDRLVKLAGEGYDVAIRIVKEPNLALVARALAPVRRKVCATPD
jgi:DNA-binding transcriptional LysR family regulator